MPKNSPRFAVLSMLAAIAVPTASMITTPASTTLQDDIDIQWVRKRDDSKPCGLGAFASVAATLSITGQNPTPPQSIVDSGSKLRGMFIQRVQSGYQGLTCGPNPRGFSGSYSGYERFNIVVDPAGILIIEPGPTGDDVVDTFRTISGDGLEAGHDIVGDGLFLPLTAATEGFYFDIEDMFDSKPFRNPNGGSSFFWGCWLPANGGFEAVKITIPQPTGPDLCVYPTTGNAPNTCEEPTIMHNGEELSFSNLFGGAGVPVSTPHDLTMVCSCCDAPDDYFEYDANP